MIVSNGNGATQQTQGGLDWQSLVNAGATLINQLFGDSQKQELERQRIELEASLRKKVGRRIQGCADFACSFGDFLAACAD